MTSPVSSSSRADISASIESTSSITPKKTPPGISSSKTTISDNSKKGGFFKTVSEFIRIILKSIFKAILDVFYCIIPIKNIFVKKQGISTVEKKYYEYQRKLYRVDSLSPMLAKSEAQELLSEFNVFEILGRIKLEEKNQDESLPLLSFFIQREQPSLQEIIKMGKDVANNDHLKLIAVLKQYYTDQIPKLEVELRKEKESS